MRECGLCGAPEMRFPEGKSRTVAEPARPGDETEKLEAARVWRSCEPEAEEE